MEVSKCHFLAKKSLPAAGRVDCSMLTIENFFQEVSSFLALKFAHAASWRDPRPRMDL